MLSVIIPTYNEKANLDELVRRLSIALIGISHELVFVDDRSTDGSKDVLLSLKKKFHADKIRILDKQGVQGKAQALLEGIVESRGEIIAMIDADLQYAPEAIPAMYDQLSKYDIVIGNRKISEESIIRRISSKIFGFIFGRVVLNLPYDVQSGLKVFRKQILDTINLSPTPWGFDYDFLFKARRMGWRIGQIDIIFAKRQEGISKVNVLKTSFELAFGAVKLRLVYLLRSVFKFTDWPHKSEALGVQWDNKTDFLYLPEIMAAKKHIYAETVSLFLMLVAIAAAGIYVIHKVMGVGILVVISGIMAGFYIVMMWFKLRVIYKATQTDFIDFSTEEIEAINPYDLPMYTILIPLRQEAEVIPQIIRAMTGLDYPPEKLDIIITLEEYDRETYDAIQDANPPDQFKVLILPDVLPKTKPKALNVAFPHTKGEFLVIYDAEIIPDRDQLKKAYLAFQQYPAIDALQTRLDHYNPEQSVITRLFNEEFAFHFDMLLPGLQKLGYPIPLSGHSVHFRRYALEEVGAWDPYNVTEDADMGMRLARAGSKIGILDSISREEATISISAWIGQRTRWIKGFIQTAIVHLRHPVRFKNESGIGWGGLLAFVITVPASVVINISNLVFWFLLIGWFTTHSHYIQSLFPSPIFYTSLIAFVMGNLIFVYLNLLSSYTRGRYAMVKYGLLSPVYWIMLAYASVKAAIEFVIKPHHWSKTMHGKHLPVPEKVKTYAQVKTTSPQL